MELRNKHKKDIFVLAGDFNLPDTNWSEQTISPNQYTVGTNQTYLDIASDNGLEQIVDFPTRNENTLDLIFTSHPSYKQRCKPIPAIGNIESNTGESTR
jgi:endonuclease/exonuclease/phosphatase family metal-dependent hydrolase